MPGEHMKNEVTIDVGNRILNRRIQLGLTQKQVVDEVERISSEQYDNKLKALTRSYLSLVERGETNITVTYLAGLCLALDMSADEVIYGAILQPSEEGAKDRIPEDIVTDAVSLKGYHLAKENALVRPLFTWVQKLGAEKVELLTNTRATRLFAKTPIRRLSKLMDFIDE